MKRVELSPKNPNTVNYRSRSGACLGGQIYLKDSRIADNFGGLYRVQNPRPLGRVALRLTVSVVEDAGFLVMRHKEVD